MCIVTPDCARIGEALLLSHGFTEASTLSWKLTNVLDCLHCQVRILSMQFDMYPVHVVCILHTGSS